MMRNKLILGFFGCFAVLVAAVSCQTEQELNYARYFVNGKSIYEKNCQNCHNSDGSGLSKLYPPLTDTTYLSLNREILACIIKNGMDDPIVINKQYYKEKMPANGHLTPIDIAQVLTYVGNSFGNKLGQFTVEEVEKNLQNCK